MDNIKKYFHNSCILEKLEKIERTVEALEREGKRIFPPLEKRYQAFMRTPQARVKVVILGQDPYYRPNQANGLCFSTEKGITLPPSLKNIYSELEEDLGLKAPPNGDLTFWADQGVLLLNTILTVEEGLPLSHKHLGWQEITRAFLEQILRQKTPLAICLWGKEAEKFFSPLQEYIGEEHLLLKSNHPSPLSANRGFFGSKPFSKINQFLTRNGLSPILWSKGETLVHLGKT
jgi:uracil-DNA glycosylase